MLRPMTAACILVGTWGATLALGMEPPHAPPDPATYWQVDDVKEGMTGHGLTVLRGSKIERFDVGVLGVMRHYSPGRDMILARVSGLGLEKTGVIAGMSGSPVYLQNKLLGAVASTWTFGTEPICGITPFGQMVDYTSGPSCRPRGAVAVASYEIHGDDLRQVPLASIGLTPSPLSPC